jgi:hypothetical protein
MARRRSPRDASDMFEEVFEELMYLRAFSVWRSDDVPIFYWCAEDWVTRVEEGVRHMEKIGELRLSHK